MSNFFAVDFLTNETQVMYFGFNILFINATCSFQDAVFFKNCLTYTYANASVIKNKIIYIKP